MNPNDPANPATPGAGRATRSTNAAPPMAPGPVIVKKKSGAALWITVGVSVILLGCMGVVGILGVGILLPALGKARQMAQQVKDEALVTQIGLALQSYSNAYNGSLPENPDDWHTRLINLGYLPDALQSAVDETIDPAWHYIPRDTWNTGPVTLVLYQDPAIQRDDELFLVLMSDGTVEKLPWDEVERLIQNAENAAESPDDNPSDEDDDNPPDNDGG